MADIISFATSLPRLRGDSGPCDLCNSLIGLLAYTVQSDDGMSQNLHGYCCTLCASNLVAALAGRQLAGIRKSMEEAKFEAHEC